MNQFYKKAKIMGNIIAHANHIFLVLPNIMQGSKRCSKRIANRIYYRP